MITSDLSNFQNTEKGQPEPPNHKIQYSSLFLGVGDPNSLVLNPLSMAILFTHTDLNVLMVNCPYNTSETLVSFGIDPLLVTDITLTNCHMNNVAGLPKLVYLNSLLNKKIKLHTTPYLSIYLWEKVLSGCMQYTNSGEKTLHDYFDVNIVEADESFDINGSAFTLSPLPHINHESFENYGLEIDGKYMYATNTSQPIPDKNYNAIFQDVAFDPWDTNHAQFKDIAEVSYSKKMFLVGYPDNWEDYTSDVAKHTAGYVSDREIIPL
jgi:hypothetical protein